MDGDVELVLGGDLTEALAHLDRIRSGDGEFVGVDRILGESDNAVDVASRRIDRSRYRAEFGGGDAGLESVAQDGDGIEAALVARPCRQFADLALQTVNRGESSAGRSRGPPGSGRANTVDGPWASGCITGGMQPNRHCQGEVASDQNLFQILNLAVERREYRHQIGGDTGLIRAPEADQQRLVIGWPVARVRGHRRQGYGGST
ncbi:MAG: hypothetical protein V9F03_12760 [Microthrixaceae bacterium]